MNKLLVLPHQDDELFCYSQLDNNAKVVIVFKGGGSPKGYRMAPEELYKKRCAETIKTCTEMGVSGVMFLGVQRPYSERDLDRAIESLLIKETYDVIVTTMVEDKHPDHRALSKSVLKYTDRPTYGFIVQTQALKDYSEKYPPDICKNIDHIHKIKLADNYTTQKHFLPNVISRGAYKTERYWRLN